MYDIETHLEFKSLKYLNSESSDQNMWNTLEVIIFDKFVQIHREALKWYK